MVFQRVAGFQTGWGGGGGGGVTLVRVGLNFRKTPHLKWEHVIRIDNWWGDGPLMNGF